MFLFYNATAVAVDDCTVRVSCCYSSFFVAVVVVSLCLLLPLLLLYRGIDSINS